MANNPEAAIRQASAFAPAGVGNIGSALLGHSIHGPVDRAMQAAFASAGLGSDAYVSPINGPRAELLATSRGHWPLRWIALACGA